MQAAHACGRSLQKALALPSVATLCTDLAHALESRHWKPGRHTRFAVQEPKVREVFAPSFADRIVQTWLAMRMEPILERCLIDDTFANRKGKGPLAAVRKAQKYMRQPGHIWYMQLDVRSYFHSVHRPTLLRLWLAVLERQPEPQRDLMRFISTSILEHDSTKGHRLVGSSRELLEALPPEKTLLCAKTDTGMPIGSTTSQHFANFYLNPLDHFVKHSLRIKGYVRYMDDLLLLGPDSASLCRWRDAIAEFLARELSLTLHPDKEHLAEVNQGMEYLGYRVYPHHLHPCARTVNALKARLDFFKHMFWPEDYPRCQHPMRGIWQGLLETRELVPPVASEWLVLKRMEATINCYLGLMSHTNSHRLRKNLYERHFGPLRQYFIPARADYAVVHVRKHLLYF